jgi:hypothetical protein
MGRAVWSGGSGLAGFCQPLVTTEILKASKNASRYMSAFKIVGSQESVVRTSPLFLNLK